MFHSFHVMINDALIQAEQSQKIGQKFVPVHNLASQIRAGCGQNEPAIFLVFQKTFRIESLYHVRHAGLRNLQRRRDIDNPSVSLGINQFQDAFQIILDGSGTAERGLRSFISSQAAKLKSQVI
jgi:hypothetical protein